MRSKWRQRQFGNAINYGTDCISKMTDQDRSKFTDRELGMDRASLRARNNGERSGSTFTIEFPVPVAAPSPTTAT